jgi:hypothetical protein
MDRQTSWQINELEGTFGICVELTETPTFVISYDSADMVVLGGGIVTE